MNRQLLRDRDVKFAGKKIEKSRICLLMDLWIGYKMPHPLENKIEIKVQTNGEKRPTEAFVKAIDSINHEINICQKEFEKKLKDFISGQAYSGYD